MPQSARGVSSLPMRLTDTRESRCATLIMLSPSLWPAQLRLLPAIAEQRKVIDTFASAGVASEVYHKEMFLTDEALAGEDARACPL